MSTQLVSIPYIYPLCPLNFNHAKMFVIADLLARYKHSKGKQVLFPVASHYSGNTAQSTAESLKRVFEKKQTPEDTKTFKLHRSVYKTPVTVLQSFVDSQKLLDYYTQEIYWELRSLKLSADFEHSYATSHPDFAVFVRAMIHEYEKYGLLVKNEKSELALNYDDPSWKKEARTLIEKTSFNQEFHKTNILAAMKNIRNDWGFLRTTGYGVTYKKKWIIDPMFDSELFTLFDLYMVHKDTTKNTSKTTEAFFAELFAALKSGRKTKNPLVTAITADLPCNVFVCEEHLKNWVVKKFYAESKLLHPKYRTKEYLVLGMGLLDGKRMSASRGHAILSKDLISKYGRTSARLILLLSGGNIAKTCNYDRSLPATATSMVGKFTLYFLQLVSLALGSKAKQPITHSTKKITRYANTIDTLIEEGNYRQAAIELLVTIPNDNPNFTHPRRMLAFYETYLEIILPGFFERFVTKK